MINNLVVMDVQLLLDRHGEALQKGSKQVLNTREEIRSLFTDTKKRYDSRIKEIRALETQRDQLQTSMRTPVFEQLEADIRATGIKIDEIDEQIIQLQLQKAELQKKRRADLSKRDRHALKYQHALSKCTERLEELTGSDSGNSIKAAENVSSMLARQQAATDSLEIWNEVLALVDELDNEVNNAAPESLLEIFDKGVRKLQKQLNRAEETEVSVLKIAIAQELETYLTGRKLLANASKTQLQNLRNSK